MQTAVERVSASIGAHREQESGVFMYRALGDAGFDMIDTLLTLDEARVDPLALIMLRAESFNAYWNKKELLDRSWECIERVGQRLSPKTTIRNLTLPGAIEGLEVANYHRMQDIREAGTNGAAVQGVFLYPGSPNGHTHELPSPSVKPMDPYDPHVGNEIYRIVTDLVQRGEHVEAYALARKGSQLASEDPRAYRRARTLEQVVAPAGTRDHVAQELVKQALDHMQALRIKEAECVLAVAAQVVPDLHSLPVARAELVRANSRAIQKEETRRHDEALEEAWKQKQLEQKQNWQDIKDRVRQTLIDWDFLPQAKAQQEASKKGLPGPDEGQGIIFSHESPERATFVNGHTTDASMGEDFDGMLRPPQDDPVEEKFIAIRNAFARGEAAQGLVALVAALSESPSEARYTELVDEALRVLYADTVKNVPSGFLRLMREQFAQIVSKKMQYEY